MTTETVARWQEILSRAGLRRRTAVGPRSSENPGRSPRRRLWINPAFLLVGALLLTLVGCATERPFVWVRDLPAAAATEDERDGIIHPRDTIAVAVRDQAALSGEFVVRDDGGFLQPTLGNIMAAGRTPVQLASELKVRL
jgi:hypothetical protein